MARTDSYVRQHNEISELVRSVEGMLTPAALETQADEARKLLSGIAGKLSIHLAMEDKSLYPAMVSSANAEAKKMAEEYEKEMGTLAGTFKSYVGDWPSGAKIKEHAGQFCQRTKEVFKALRDRMEREEKNLYPLADKV